VQNLLVGREEGFLPSPELVFIRVHSWSHPNCADRSPTRAEFTLPAA
jgi:hypothetical protein